MRIHIVGGTYEDAVKKLPEGKHIKRVRTHRARTLAMPERIQGKNGDRIFGAERKNPKTNGSVIHRTFIL